MATLDEIFVTMNNYLAIFSEFNIKADEFTKKMTDVSESTNAFTTRVVNLSESTNEFTTKVVNVSEGTDELTTKIISLSEGTDELTEKIINVSEGIDEFTKKITDASEGTDEFTKKITDESEGTDAFTKKMMDVNESADEFTKKITDISEGINELTEKIIDVSEGADEFTKKITDISEGTDEFTKKITDVSEGTDEFTKKIMDASEGTDEVTKKLTDASEGTGEFNDKLQATGASAEKASGKLSKYLNAANLIKAAIKGMEIADEFININSRLELVNDGLQTQSELQDKIFQAADRSSGSYSDMASTVSTLGSNAKDVFKTNDEAIAFTELLQKSMKVSGLSGAEQSNAMGQVAQTMGNGTLTSGDFNSITDKVPTIMDALITATGKSEEELNNLASAGLMTADIIKDAMFIASDQINEQFDSMDVTFAEIWSRIKNAALKAIQPIIGAVSELINSAAFKDIVDSIIIGINFLSSAVSGIIDFIVANWPLIQSILTAIGLYLAVTLLPGFIKVGMAGLISGLKIAAGWIAANAPMIMMIATIALIIYALTDAGVTATDVFSAITGSINVVIQFFKNLGLEVANIALGIGSAIGALGTNIEAAFHNAICSVQSWWYGMLSTALTVIGKIAEELNKLPFVKFDYSGVTSAADDYAAKAAEAAGNKKEYASISDAFNKGYSTFDTFQDGWLPEAYQSGADWGANKIKQMEDMLNKVSGEKLDMDIDKDKVFFPDDFKMDPITVNGTAENNSVEVNMENEDIKYLRDIAERDYINKFSTNTLAPNVAISFGDVHQEADADKVAGRIKMILQEEIATAAEGAY